MDYSNREAYLINGEFNYRTVRYSYPNGNNQQTYYNDFGVGRGQYQKDPAAAAIGNPYLSCYEQPPITWMQTMPLVRDSKGMKVFADKEITKNIFAPGNN